ncbi:glycosyltransferase family 1 protein [Candidatus Planktophila lacus]|uniref:Glycosyltransferase n=1 Tax=Candidatus Planktophila lacus TaxID=1884913 RepID=A0AAD0E2M8_9ACTN|nr:glycosyltransferase family 1 protein [Candidatus Planktophila lacus]ASY10039.1 glycosyltransferase [Candidatus Planktophila lacus]
MENKDRYSFFSLAGFSYSRGAVYLNGGERLFSSNSKFTEVPSKLLTDLPSLISRIRSAASQNSKIVVLSPSHLLVPVIKIITGKSIILDAGWSLTEAEIARWHGIGSVPRIVKCLIIDFLAFQLASKIIVETNHQKSFISSRFLIRKNKIIVLMTGFDEVNFNEKSKKPFELEDTNGTVSQPIVLFRGSYTNEAGFELLSEVSKRMENIDIQFIISSNRIPRELVFGKNTILISRRISNREMKYLYEIATVCIGQITNRPRLKNTIPHKAFEAAFFGKPYLSSDTLGIREFLPENNQCYYLEESSVACLEKAILEITANAKIQSDLSLNIAKRYKEVATQATLSLKFFEIISN